MNDALCELTWAGPKKQNIKMGYICEMPNNDRKRRSVSNEVPQACQVEYRTRKGAVESIRMNCKERIWPSLTLKWTNTIFVHRKLGLGMRKWVQSEIMNMNSDEEKIRGLLIGVISRIILYLYFDTWTFHVFINFHVHDCSRISLSTVCSIQNHKSV